MRTEAATATSTSAAKRRARPVSWGVNPDPELRIFLEHFLIPLRLIGSGHSILSAKPRKRNRTTFQISIDNPSIELSTDLSGQIPLEMPPIAPLSRTLPAYVAATDDGNSWPDACCKYTRPPSFPLASACVRQQRKEFGSHDFWRSREFLSESWRAAQTAAAASPSPSSLSAAAAEERLSMLLMGKREYPPLALFLFPMR